ncbi:glycosyltransferase family 2 protein [Anatilimnocola sp. NA78]|uniref:glycosyltransferase family 2 protein n=1 Tax=Anatilimnocola sp. NA78 TaxID=3415683 RepID=UPI003CE47461
MKFSLVVPTVGRPAELQRFIDHLQRQGDDRVKLRELELIVVDQSGKPDTGELVARLQAEFSIRHLPMSGRGASRARNYGWGFAQGEILTFPDDDSHYPDGFLRKVLECFDDPQVDAISATVEFIGRSDTEGGLITRDNVLYRCIEAAFFGRRERLGDIRYDERMGIGCATPWNSDEGPDLLLRMMERGLRTDYHPEMIIHHPNPLQTEDENLQQRNFKYSRGRGYLLRKHHFPLTMVAKTLARSLAGSAFMALRLRPFWARYYWNAFLGKMQGYLAGKNAPAQELTSPLSSLDASVVASK